MNKPETLTKSQAQTLAAICSETGWIDYWMLRALGGSAASCPKLVRLGLIEVREVGVYESKEWRMAQIGVPQDGSIEMLVLQKLIDNQHNGGGGICFLDFAKELGITYESLKDVIDNLRTGNFIRRLLH